MTKMIAVTREVTGKKSKNLRKAGLIPAAAYGPSQDSISLQVDAKEFAKAYKAVGHSRLVDVDLNGKQVKGLIKEVQVHPVTRQFVHASLYVVDMEQEIEAEVPVEIIGLAPAVKNNLGFLEVPLNSIDVKCLPAKLPAKLEVNVEKLEQVGDAVTAADLNLEEGVQLLIDDLKTKLAFIAAPQKIEEETPAATAETVEGAEGEAAATEGATTEAAE